MKKYLALFAFVILSIFANAQELRSFQIDNLYGFKDKDKVVISPQYQYASEFYGDYALVKSNNLWGYIDKKNNWTIKPQYDQAELMLGGKARVYKNGKIGMIDSLGNMILPIEFDRIEESYYGYELFKGEKKGLLSDKGDFVDAKYDEVSRYYRYTVAKYGNKYDIFFNNKPLFEGSEKNPELKYYSWLTFIDVYKDGKGALIGDDGKLLTDFIYSDIKSFSTPSYPSTIENSNYTFMVYLERSETDPQTEQNIPIYDIIRADRVWLSDKPFDQIFVPDFLNYNDEKVLSLRQNGYIAEINESGYAEVSNYSDIYEYMSRNLKVKSKKITEVYSLGYEPKLIRTFNYLALPITDVEYVDYETGETWIEQQISAYGNVLVSDDSLATPFSGKKAMYDLTFNQYMTVEMDTLPEIYSVEYANDMSYYIFWKNSKYNIWYDGQPPVKDFPYTFAQKLGPSQVHVIDEAGKSWVIDLVSQNRFDIGNYIPEWSFNMKSTVFNEVVDDYNPEYYYGENYEAPRYNSNFIHLTDTVTGKVGFIFGDHYVKPQFDSIIQISINGDLPILHLKAGDNWGSYYARTKDLVMPTFASPIAYKTFDGIDYYPFGDYSEQSGYYLDTKGRRFYYQPFDVFENKTKSGWGLETYNSFTGDETPINVTPHDFKQMRSNETHQTFTAQNKKKKWGIINWQGDTILPFEYSGISYIDMAYDEMYSVMLIKKGKKKGYINLVNNKTIPAIYDDLEELSAGDFLIGTLVHLDDKVGWYDKNFNLILPAEYDGIDLRFSTEFGYEIAVKKGEKMAFLHTHNIYNNLQERLAQTLWYDRVAGDYAYILENNKWKQYNKLTGEYLKTTDSPESVLFYDFYEFFFSNGLIGIKDIDGNVISKPTMKWLHFNDMETLIIFEKGYTYFTYPGSDDKHLKNQW